MKISPVEGLPPDAVGDIESAWPSSASRSTRFPRENNSRNESNADEMVRFVGGGTGSAGRAIRPAKRKREGRSRGTARGAAKAGSRSREENGPYAPGWTVIVVCYLWNNF